MSARAAVRCAWLLFLMLAIALVALPTQARAPNIEVEIRYHLDEKSGMAVLPETQLLLMQQLNQRLADEVRRLQDKTGCT
ncbi:MAG: hypothetical protein Q8L65_17265 [Burkholderiales bacterium]|nr:hypothetical protein [Burkholderiales bacterium]MDP2398863.1 hypothetical protein [Burkholderiales bacterium]MDP3715968.1 hypothetical protein [Burkholderiales bacterium]